MFPRLLQRAVSDQPTVDSGGVRRGRSVAVADGCLHFTHARHFNGPSTPLSRHFHGTSIAKKKEEEKIYIRESVSPVCGIPCTPTKVRPTVKL